MIYLSW